MHARFADWNAVLASLEPPSDLAHVRGMLHYARRPRFAARHGNPASDSRACERLPAR